MLIILYFPNHTSKLEKADILEKTEELFDFFEHQLAQISQVQHQTAVHTIRALFEGLRRLKISPEVGKAVDEVVALMFAPRIQPYSPKISLPSFSISSLLTSSSTTIPFTPPTSSSLAAAGPSSSSSSSSTMTNYVLQQPIEIMDRKVSFIFCFSRFKN